MGRRPGAGPGGRIAVLDDDAPVRESLAALLQAYRLHPVTFASADQFLAAYRPHEFKCLVLDFNLGDSNAAEVLGHIAAAEGEPLPFILITSRLDARVRRTASRFGALAVLEKPFKTELLLEALARLP
jgi:two-component system, LuxR family, response regulator FixJ